MSNIVEKAEVLVNSNDPANAVKISNDTEASRTLNFVQGDIFQLKLLLNTIDHSTGVITAGGGGALGSDTITGAIKSTDYQTTFFSFGSFSANTETSSASAVANVFDIYVNSTSAANLTGHYVIIPSVTASGVETNHLYYFDSGASPPPQEIDAVYKRVDISGGTFSENLKTAIHADSEFSATRSNDIVQVTAATGGAFKTEPTTDEPSVLGIAKTTIGKDAVTAITSHTAVVTGQSMTYASGEQSKDAKLIIEINNSGGTQQRTIVRQDCTILRSS